MTETTERTPAVKTWPLFLGMIDGSKKGLTPEETAGKLGMRLDTFRQAMPRVKKMVQQLALSVLASHLIETCVDEETGKPLTDEQANEAAANLLVIHKYDVNCQTEQKIYGKVLPFVPSLKDARSTSSNGVIPKGATENELEQAMALLGELRKPADSAETPATEETGEASESEESVTDSNAATE